MKRLLVILVLAVILCGGCKPKQAITLKIPGTSAQIAMRLIPDGYFTMGSPSTEVDRDPDEGAQHLVYITEPFYMGVYEVTQEQWEAVMGENPSYFGPDPGLPVERVSWDDCQAFIAALNTKGIGTFRLPTEAEWEYACRAGSTTRFSWGDDPGYSEIGDYAWYWDNSTSMTHTVGGKKPNAWGLYDMSGNVWEWCSDWYETPYGVGHVSDPQGPTTGSYRVFRGGAWIYVPLYCRSANRNYVTPASSYYYLGFRLVRIAP